MEVITFTDAQVSAIKGLIGRVSDAELQVFLHLCQRTKLDPFARQIYAIPRGGKMTVQTSIDGYRVIAERTGCYAPGQATQFAYNDGKLVSATAYVRKLVAGTWHEVAEVAFWDEYNGGTPFWKKMPTTMLAKVAEARALRRAFPQDLSGLYVSEEMDQAGKQETLEDAEVTYISDEQWKALDAYINGDQQLRHELKTVCKVSDLRHITEQQLSACREYARQRKLKLGGENHEG